MADIMMYLLKRRFCAHIGCELMYICWYMVVDIMYYVFMCMWAVMFIAILKALRISKGVLAVLYYLPKL